VTVSCDRTLSRLCHPDTPNTVVAGAHSSCIHAASSYYIILTDILTSPAHTRHNDLPVCVPAPPGGKKTPGGAGTHTFTGTYPAAPP